jgi:hypothetical protein
MRAKMFAGQSETSAKNEPDFQRFQNFVQRLVAVPHSEIKAALDAEKKAKKQKRASRASSGTD